MNTVANTNPQRSDRLPGFDGLRAISVAMVVFGHANNTARTPLEHEVLGTLGQADLGVTIFFVISGFLITRLLLREHARTGTISLRDFYVRRGFRILPPLLLYMLALSVLVAAGKIAIAGSSFFAALSFTWNYGVGRGEWWLGHCWSLSVEEQFYLFWPLFVLQLGPGRARRLAWFVIAIEPLVRVGSYFLLPSSRPYIPIMGHTRIDSLLFGCALAFAERDGLHARWRRFLESGYAPALAIAVILVGRVMRLRWTGSWVLPCGFTLDSAAAAVVLYWVANRPRSVVDFALEAPPVRWVGRISYGVYLWQQLFLAAGEWQPIAFPLKIVPPFVVAALSYYLVERPILRLRDRAVSPAPALQAVGDAG